MIKGYKKIIDETLVQYFDEVLYNKTHKFAKKTAESMKYTTCLGGKRLRGVLCLESCRLISGDYFPAIASACALEMLHSQSLIHDDLPCMDNDNLRRGKPSNHIVFGEDIATLAGDALISLGAQTIIDKSPESIKPENLIKILREYNKAAGIYGIVGGQTADIEAENTNFTECKNTEELLKYIQKYKTGALFVASCTMGALAGNGDENKIDGLKKFAHAFGTAFQMADDILDVISTSEDMGKTTGKDEKENKLTYIKKYGLQGAKEKLNSQIITIYDILKKAEIESETFKKVINSAVSKIF